VVQPSRFGRMFAVVVLSMFSMCVTARAQKFSAPQNVSNNADFSLTPVVATDAAGNIYMAWEDDTAKNSNILFAYSKDGFLNVQNLSKTTGFSFGPRIAVDASGGVNVVWIDDTPGYSAVMFSRSPDGGKSFPTVINLSNGPGNAANPQIATDASGNISVVWESDSSTLGVFYTHSTLGANFSTPVNLATNATGSNDPQVAADGNGNVYVVWEDKNNLGSNISFNRSVDNGASFLGPKSLSNDSASSVNPQLAVDSSGNVSVIWADNAPGTYNIFFTRSNDKGVTFPILKNISNNGGNSGSPQISVDGSGNVYAVWQGTVQPASKDDIFFAHSPDGGTTFGPLVNLGNTLSTEPFPALIVDAAGSVNVSWTDSSLGNPQTFFTQSTDRGATFAATQNLSNDAGFASGVQMAADSKGNLDVVWSDDAPGANQIFFSRLPTAKKANQPPVANAGPDQMVDCTGHSCALVTLDGTKSSDPDGDALSFVWTDESKNLVGTSAVAQFTVPMGAHTFTLTVTDAGGLTSTAVTHVTVRDTKPPTLQVSLSPKVIGPREGKLVLVNATINVSDVCDANPSVKLVSITSNDPADRGQRKVNDVQAFGGGPVPFGTDVRSFLLRAERSEGGKGLVYTITYSATDASGNTTTATAQAAVVRHSSGGSHNGSRDEDDDKNEKRDNKEHNRSRD
jgi:hypothetical protein